MTLISAFFVLGGGTVVYFCCCKEWLDQDFGELNAEKPTGDTHYFHKDSGQLVPAAVFPNQNGKWNVTIKESEETLRLGIAGLYLMDVDEKDVYIQEPDFILWGRTGQEWFKFLPGFIIRIAPITFACVFECPDIPQARTWILIFGIVNWFQNLVRFMARIGDPNIPPQTPAKKFIKLTYLCVIGFVIWGATLTWPKADKGITDDLDCQIPLFYIIFMQSSLFICGFCVVMTYRCCHKVGCYQKIAYYFEDDLRVMGEFSRNQFDMEMSVSEI